MTTEGGCLADEREDRGRDRWRDVVEGGCWMVCATMERNISYEHKEWKNPCYIFGIQ